MVTKYMKKSISRNVILLIFMFFSFVPAQLLNGACATDWALINYQKGDVLRAASHNGSIFVAVGDAGILWTSANGIDWTVRARNKTNQFAIIYAASKFVTVGAKGYIATSSNGINWAERATPTTEGLWGVAYGNGTFVVCGNKGTVLTSPDAVTWTKQTSGISANLLDIVYGNGLFIMVGGTTVFKSANGTTWSTAYNAADGLIAATFGNGFFLTGGKNGAVYKSANGTTWAKKNTGPEYIWDLCYTGAGFVGVGGRGYVISGSLDGNTWTSRNSTSTNTFMGVYHNNDRVVAVGQSTQIALSLCDPGAASPQLIVAAPNGNEEWDTGTTQTIRWGSLGTMGNVKLEYSTNDGDSWTTIASSTADDANHSWKVPDVSSTRCRVRVSEASDSDPVDSSNSVFAISGSGGVVNTIRIISPNGGQTWQSGTTQNITWTGSTKFSKIDIEYYTGSEWKVIVNGTADDGLYSWLVPSISTTQAKIWIKGYDGSTNPTDYSDAVFTINSTGEGASITIQSPNGGEDWAGGSAHNITWTGYQTFSKIDIEYFNGSGWNPIVSGTADDGSYSWTLPDIATSKARIWIKGYDGGTNPTDYSDNTFTISGGTPSASITVTSPNGGEEWEAGTVHTVKWSTTGTVGNVKIQYSTNAGSSWPTIVSSTGNDGGYSWTVPDKPSEQCLVRVYEASDETPSDSSNANFSIISPQPKDPPEIVLDRTKFNFGYAVGGNAPCPQELFIYNGGDETLNWTAAADAGWINLNPTSGNDGGVVTVSIDPGGLNPGTHNGTITVSDPNAVDPSKTVTVNLTVKTNDEAPFGDFTTPLDGTADLSGSVAITGWALDDVCVESVKIYVDVAGLLVYIDDAVFIEGARPDVEQYYPNHPNSSRAGWGYMMLSNFLPDQGNGTYTIYAKAADNNGNEVTLGIKTITVDNEHAVKPFGAMDTPAQGGDVSGSNYRNYGWALTSMPNKIFQNYIDVYVDSFPIGKATYNSYRSDIATLFPGYANSSAAGGYFDFDTTAYSNGVHSISWTVTDNAGNSEGIGSRFFVIQNTGGGAGQQAQSTELRAGAQGVKRIPGIHAAVNRFEPISVKRGYNDNLKPREIYPDEEGITHLESKELERIVLQLSGPAYSHNPSTIYAGYHVVNNQLRKLPVGSKLDSKAGIFYWQPGPGFTGEYELAFFARCPGGTIAKTRILLKINPKFPMNR